MPCWSRSRGHVCTEDGLLLPFLFFFTPGRKKSHANISVRPISCLFERLPLGERRHLSQNSTTLRGIVCISELRFDPPPLTQLLFKYRCLETFFLSNQDNIEHSPIPFSLASPLSVNTTLSFRCQRPPTHLQGYISSMETLWRGSDWWPMKRNYGY